MGINLQTYFLYQIDEQRHLLLKANRPGYGNANQNQENQAEEILEQKIDLLLKQYLKVERITKTPQLIGMFQGLPEGDIFYEQHGQKSLENVWYSPLKTNKQLIYLTIAPSQEAFLAIIREEGFADNGLKKEDLQLPPLQLPSTDFITENDFDLSSIPDAYTFDLEDKR